MIEHKIIPDKNLFIVTSALKPTIGKFKFDERFEQTINTLKSIRNKVPDAIIILADVSVYSNTEEEISEIQKYNVLHFNLSNEPTVKELSEKGMKSQAETVLLFNVMVALKRDPNLQKILYSVKRIFKMTGRGELEDDFDITDYDNLFGKYVFKKRIPSWMSNGPSDLLVTRLFSFCPSLLDNYISVLQQNFPLLSSMDTEHAHFVNIPKPYLVEFEKVHMKCMVASTGVWHYD